MINKRDARLENKIAGIGKKEIAGNGKTLEGHIVTIVIAYNCGAAIVIACHLAEERCYCHS
jgi:hypothetical protein